MRLTLEQRDDLTDTLAWKMADAMSIDALMEFFVEKQNAWLEQQGDEDLLVLAEHWNVVDEIVNEENEQ